MQVFYMEFLVKAVVRCEKLYNKICCGYVHCCQIVQLEKKTIVGHILQRILCFIRVDLKY